MYTIHVIFELNHNLARFPYFKRIENLKWAKYKIQNQFLNHFTQFGIILLRQFPTQFHEIKENYQNLTIRNSMEQNFM